MRLAGDWVFYLYLLKNNSSLSYVPNAISYHNLHGSNTSLNEFAKDYWFIEHSVVYNFVNSFFDVSYNVFVNFRFMIF